MQALSKASQENVLVLLCFDSENCQFLQNVLSLDLFDPPYYRDVAAKAFAYIERYKTAPHDHIADELMDKLSGEHGPVYREILGLLYSTRPKVNSSYVMNTVRSFVESRRFQNAIVTAANLEKQGDLESAKDCVRTLLRNTLELFDPGTRLSDVRNLFFEESEEAIPTGIYELDIRGIGPTRRELVLFIAPTGKGKTWAGIHLGKVAMLSGCRVCHITLELSSKKTYQRYVQALLSLTQRQVRDLRSPLFVRDGSGEIQSIDYSAIDRPSLQDEDVLKLVSERFQKFGNILTNLIIKEFPTSMLTLNGLNAYLDMLERAENFQPDVLVLDYADLMAVDRAQYRLELNELCEKLRGIAVERNLALVTFSQSNKAGATARLVEMQHAGEAYGKNATADTVITYTQTAEEYKRKLARLYVEKGRSVAGARCTTLIAQNYDVGAFCLDSALLPSDYDPYGARTGSTNAAA